MTMAHGPNHDMDELIDHVARRAGIDRAQAQAAIDAVLEHFTANLPSPVVGRMRELLRRGGAAPSGQNAAKDDAPTP